MGPKFLDGVGLIGMGWKGKGHMRKSNLYGALA